MPDTRQVSSYDTTLASARWLSEITAIGRSSQHTGHGRDVEAEERTANGGEAANGVDVVEGLHPAKQRSGLGGEGAGLLWSLKLGWGSSEII